jgi:hypothetical protein
MCTHLKVLEGVEDANKISKKTLYSSLWDEGWFLVTNVYVKTGIII